MFWSLAPPIWAVREAFRPDSRPYLRAGSAGGHSHAQERSGVAVTLGVYDFSRHPARIDRLETRMDAGPVFTTLITCYGSFTAFIFCSLPNSTEAQVFTE